MGRGNRKKKNKHPRSNQPQTEAGAQGDQQTVSDSQQVPSKIGTEDGAVKEHKDNDSKKMYPTEKKPSYADVAKRSETKAASTSKVNETSKTEAASTSKDSGTEWILQTYRKEMKKEGMLNVMKLFILVNEYGQELLQDLFLFEISRVKKETISKFFASRKQMLFDLTLKQEDNSVPLKTADLRKIYKDKSMKCDEHMQGKCCCNYDVKDNIDLLILDFDVSLMGCILLHCLKLESINGEIRQLRTCKNKLSHIPKDQIHSVNVISNWEIAATSIIGISRHLGTWCGLKSTIRIKKLRLNDDIRIPPKEKIEKLIADGTKTLEDILNKCKELNKELKGCEDDASYGSYEYKPAPVPYPNDGAEDVYTRNSPLTEEEKEKQEKELFLNACKTGNQDDEDVIKMMKIDVNFFSQDGKTPLYLASWHGHLSIVKMLLGKGAEVNLCNENGDGPLHAACQNGNINIVDRLIQKGASINSVSSDGSTPLYLASLHGHVSIVNILLDKGAEVNQCNKNGDSPLYAACQKGNVNIVQQLVKMTGIDINAINSSQCTPLQKACWDGYETIVNILLEKGASVNPCKEKTYGPLHIACQNGHHKIAEILLAKNANINFQGADGNTPIILACLNDMKKIFELLLKYGANVNLCNDAGYCPRENAKPDFLKLIFLHEHKGNEDN